MSLPLRLALRDLRGGSPACGCWPSACSSACRARRGRLALLRDRRRAGRARAGDTGRRHPAHRLAARGDARRSSPLSPREGRVSHITRMRAMAARLDGAESVLVELKGVDEAWPLFGTFRLQPGAAAAAARQVAIGPELAERLGVRVGDRIRIGAAELEIIGLIAEEPDRVGQGFTLGSTALVDRAGLAATGLVQPGSLYTSAYRLRLPAGADPEGGRRSGFRKRFGAAGFQVQDRTDGAPGTRRFIERLGQFLTLVGLTALIVAGIGVGNGVASYLDGKRGMIATLKLLGATSRTIFLSYLLPDRPGRARRDRRRARRRRARSGRGRRPSPATLCRCRRASRSIRPPLLASAAYGLLIAAVFALVPIARARTVPAATLFRGEPRAARAGPAGGRSLIVLAAAAAIAGLAVGTAREPAFAAGFIASALGLRAAAHPARLADPLDRRRACRVRATRSSGSRSPTSTGPAPRPAGWWWRSGLGLTLFTTLAVIETNLAGQIRTTIPAQGAELLHARHSGRGDRPLPGARRAFGAGGRARHHPLAARLGRRGRAAAGSPTWPRSRPRPGSCAATAASPIPPTLPQGSRIVAGRWWPRRLSRPAARLARRRRGPGGRAQGRRQPHRLDPRPRDRGADRLAARDQLGHDGLQFRHRLRARRAGERAAQLHGDDRHAGGAGAPLRPRRLAAPSRASPRSGSRRWSRRSATCSSSSRVAVRAAASVAILAGIAVLVGALAASRRARTYDSVILKMLGATRGRILAAQAAEFAALALIVASSPSASARRGLVGGGEDVRARLGAGLGRRSRPLWRSGRTVTLVLGLLGSLPALAARPARALRARYRRRS